MTDEMPSTDVVKRDPADLVLGSIVLTETAMEFAAAPTLSEWLGVVEWLQRCNSGMQWWCGDAVNHGLNMFGEEASQGLSAETWRRWAWVCEKVPQPVRRRTLTFSHHEAVARLEPREQKYWLDLAEQNGWSANELKRRIKADEKVAEDDDNLCPTCGKKGWSGIYAT